MADITFAKLMEKMMGMPEVIESELVKALRVSAVQVHKTAVSKFGQYQPEYGPFNAWAVLNPDYVLRKLAAGSAGDDPLIGHYSKKGGNGVYPTSLRQSLAMNVDAHKLIAQIGTNDPIGEWQELGTIHIPPRPFLRPALYQNEEFVKKTILTALGAGMVKWFR